MSNLNRLRFLRRSALIGEKSGGVTGRSWLPWILRSDRETITRGQRWFRWSSAVPSSAAVVGVRREEQREKVTTRFSKYINKRKPTHAAIFHTTWIRSCQPRPVTFYVLVITCCQHNTAQVTSQVLVTGELLVHPQGVKSSGFNCRFIKC